MAKARTSPATKKLQRSSTCKRGTIKFTTKRGKTIEFKGRAGKSCGPRPKPKTSHLKPYQRVFAQAARSCGRKKLSRGAFLNCVASGAAR
jgi:hypothetical protein